MTFTAAPRAQGAPTPPRPAATSSPAPPAEPVGRLASSAALTMFMLCSAGGLVRVFHTDGWMGPVAVTVVLVGLVCWGLRALRVPGSVAFPAVLVTGVVSLSWTALGQYTFYGLPTPNTWDHATSALHSVGQDISVMVPPVTLTVGFKILAVALAAVGAALADWVAFRLRIPLAGLAPGLAVFVFCCAAGAPTHRGPVIGFEVGGACLYLLIERTTASGKLDWFAGIRPQVNAGLIVGGGILAAVAVVAALTVIPALAPKDGAGVLGFRNGNGQGGGERIVPNPLVDLQTRLTQLGNQPVFLASSTVASYWRLTSLDSFNGVTWTSTGSYRGFGSKLPGGTPEPTGTRTVKADFTIQNLDSPWLPAQFTPISVAGEKRVTYDPSSDSLLTANNTSNGLKYTVTSYQYLDTLTPAELQSAPPIDPNGAGSGDLKLPADLDPLVSNLAVQVTGQATTEYAKALAIQNYLRGPLFHYTLTPKSDGSGTQALITFLDVTREGYCQQFAGAYAVLARAVGLPTRLAVGFVTGTAQEDSTFEVYDRDAHTWPEVYFGPQYGWVPFEPTPGFAIPGAGSYTQISASSGSDEGPGTSQTTTPTTTTASTTPSSSSVTRRVGTPSTLRNSAAPLASGHGGSSGALWFLLIPGAMLVWFAANGLLPMAARERRRRRAATAGTAAAVAQEWDEVSRDLIRYGLRRQPSETDDEYARRAQTGLARIAVVPERVTWEHGGLAGLASLSRQATYAADVPPDLATTAATTAAEIRARLAESLTLKERIMRWTAPPPGTLRSFGRRLQG